MGVTSDVPSMNPPSTEVLTGAQRHRVPGLGHTAIQRQSWGVRSLGRGCRSDPPPQVARGYGPFKKANAGKRSPSWGGREGGSLLVARGNWLPNNRLPRQAQGLQLRKGLPAALPGCGPLLRHTLLRWPLQEASCSLSWPPMSQPWAFPQPARWPGGLHTLGLTSCAQGMGSPRP